MTWLSCSFGYYSLEQNGPLKTSNIIFSKTIDMSEAHNVNNIYLVRAYSNINHFVKIEMFVFEYGVSVLGFLWNPDVCAIQKTSKDIL